MENEIWKQIPEFGWKYEVSNYGRVRSWSSHGGKKMKEPVLKTIRDNGRGYCHTTFIIGGKSQNRFIHRLVLSAFVKPMPRNIHGCHINHNRKDNRLENLKWGTPQENIADKVREKRHSFGENHMAARLNEKQVLEIRSLFKAGSKPAELQRKYSMSRNAIDRIVSNQTWKHLLTP